MAGNQKIKSVIAEVAGLSEDGLLNVEVPVKGTQTEQSIIKELRTNGLRSFDKDNSRAVWVAPSQIRSILIDFTK